MQVITDLSGMPGDLRGGVVAIGNFDGVHRGHQLLIGKATAAAAENGCPVGVLTFEPHPRRFFKPDEPPFGLTPTHNKAHHNEALGVDYMAVQSFTAETAGMTAEEFIDNVLIAGLGASHIVIGYDFCFGKGRKGTPDLLRTHGGFDVTVIDPAATHDGIIYSSTRIRDALKRGNPGQAMALLGRPFEIEARVEPGEQLGRTIGFPTANLSLNDYLRPAIGIYAVRCGVLDEETGETTWYDGAGYYGDRPTVDGKNEMFEAFLFDFSGDLYGKYLRVALIEYVREDKKFDSIEELRDQIVIDCQSARRILNTRAAGA